MRSELEPAPDETLDAIGDGRLRLLQRRHGYRFNLDAVLLAAFASRAVPDEEPFDILELGAGCGVVALLLSSWRPAARVSAVELQPALAALARRNVALNALPVEVLESDWRALPANHSVDLVVSNPPYFPPEQGRHPPDEERASARYERNGDLESLARSAAAAVKPRGAVRLIYSSTRTDDLLEALRRVRLMPTVLRFVHPRVGEPANLVLVEARPESRRPLEVEPPLIVHASSSKAYAPEVADLLSGDSSVVAAKLSAVSNG